MSPGFRRHVLMKASQVFDLAAVCVTFFAALTISAGSFTWPSVAQVLVIRIKLANLLLFAGYLGLCSAIFSACGCYRSHRFSYWQRRLYEVCLAVTLSTGMLRVLEGFFLLSFAVHEFLLVFWLLTFCALALSHEIVFWVLHRARVRGRNLRNVIIVGEGPATAALAHRVRQEANLGYRVLRIIDPRGMTENGSTAGDS